MARCSTLRIAGAIVLPNAGGYILSRIIPYNPYESKWSDGLKRPVWSPPKWAYAPIWATLFSSVGYASYIVWRDGGGFNGAKVPLTLYGIKLAIYWSWMPLVFKTESLKVGLINFGFGIPVAVACAYEFYKVNQTAGKLMIPFLLYSGFAVCLNYTLYRLNEKPSNEID